MVWEKNSFLQPPSGAVFLWAIGMVNKPNVKLDNEFTDEYEPPDEWEPIRDEDGEIVEGCYIKQRAPDSDTL